MGAARSCAGRRERQRAYRRSSTGGRGVSAGTGETDVGKVDTDRIEAIASALDLRRPNREALESIAWTSWHHFASGRPASFEGVVDSATGVGKTYIMASALDYFAGGGIRNFAVVCPRRTILNKTVEQF